VSAGTAVLIVKAAGLNTQVVDSGRPTTRGLGVPVGGAADRLALAWGNALLGNAPDAAALEVCLAGPVLQAEGDIACVLSGAPFDLLRAERPLPWGRTFNLESGQQVVIQGTPVGVRGYLCVAGGLQTPVILGSRSGLGPVTVGSRLPCLASRMASVFLDAATTPFPLRPAGDGICLRILPGVHAGLFPAGALVDGVFEVRAESNRMGVRLRGRPLPIPERDLASEPVCPGTIQVTRDGQCVILGVDAQTMGGYPKVAQVITADLDLVGQLRSGASVRFEVVKLEEAVALHRDRQRRLRRWLQQVRTARGWGVQAVLR
jgi:5-oxoprolinase (ATP-hydrolysing) subunit C